jgi:AcrR family transcriptional regulator
MQRRRLTGAADRTRYGQVCLIVNSSIAATPSIAAMQPPNPDWRARPTADPGAAVKSARERVLDAAAELFYREGIRAVGVDTIIARSGVAKMSLYRNFPSKDALVVAFLEASDRRYWEWWDRVMARHPGDPRRQLEDLFAALARRITDARWRGCPFINTATEFPDPRHPARAVCRTNKGKLRERLYDLAARLDAAQPQALADQLYLLVEGAYATSAAPGQHSPAPQLAAAARALVAAQLSAEPAQAG